MSLNQIVFAIVLLVWVAGVVITKRLDSKPSNGTSGNLGVFILTWVGAAAFTVAALLGWVLSLFFGGWAYLFAFMALIIVALWYNKT